MNPTFQQCTGFDSTFGLSRRKFLNRFGMGVGAFALADMLGGEASAGSTDDQAGGVLKKLHHTAKAKRVIFLFQSGGPSQIDLLDYKPHLNKVHGQQLPDFVRKGQRLQVPFETAIKAEDGGFIEPSKQALSNYLAKKEKLSGSLFGKLDGYTFGEDENFDIDDLISALRKHAEVPHA